MDLGLTGKKVVITGGTRGIGRAIATKMLEEGASVAICAEVKKESMRHSQRLRKRNNHRCSRRCKQW